MTLAVVVERAVGNWGAYAPDLADSVIATGDTREEAIQNFRDALLDLFDYNLTGDINVHRYSSTTAAT